MKYLKTYEFNFPFLKKKSTDIDVCICIKDYDEVLNGEVFYYYKTNDNQYMVYIKNGAKIIKKNIFDKYFIIFKGKQEDLDIFLDSLKYNL